MKINWSLKEGFEEDMQEGLEMMFPVQHGFRRTSALLASNRVGGNTM